MIVIAAATVREIKALIRDSPGRISMDSAFFTAKFGKTRLGFLTTGVGPLNAGLKLESLLASDPLIAGVVNVGIAGSYDIEQLPVGGVCTASAEVWPEYGIRGEHGFSDAGELGFPLHGSDQQAVWNRIELEQDRFFAGRGLETDLNWHQGVSITVAGASSLPAQAEVLKNRWQGMMENMEGFALAYCCLLRGIPFMEVRAVSNPVGCRDPKEWDFPAAFQALGKVWKFWHERIISC